MDMEQLQAFAPILLMVVIFYFMLWRPQKKQQKRRQEMLDSLRNGAKVITAGGIYGTIVALHDEYVMLRVADKVEIKVSRTAITQVLGKGAKTEGKSHKKEDVSDEKVTETAATPAASEMTETTKHEE
ncbi:preprotein translocase, YajC subunit [Megasphaera vaginalis (ex Srinivasan et al. 2021)]|uniref:Preprotein translocase, YajC subunit n=1 Tax=Megasphaera vaginalis (ex Srinivasan et al. 2021) TaxID=1111454 RepID=U7UH80_9FIRM|nr:preprotein translocase, YajC subunit [Megasphaera vaginalis (ex Srinivasan et al. 2021)]